MEQVTELFLLYTNLPAEQLPRWIHLCRGAITQLNRQLVDTVDISQHSHRLHQTAAAFAYADYLMIVGEGGGAGRQIKVGNITVGGDSAQTVAQDSQRLREYSAGQISDLLTIPGFVFQTIGGETPADCHR